MDILFPIHCLACSREGNWFCEACQSKIHVLDSQVCPLCEKELTPAGSLCTKCSTQERYGLDLMLSSVSYGSPAAKEMIHKLKYRFIEGLSIPLANLMAKAALLNNIPLPDALIPIPLHKRRLRWRGFNQSALLADELAKKMAPPISIPVLDILERRRYNKAQMEIKNFRERLENVKDIFVLRKNMNPDLIKKKTLLLVDDIATTGATLRECAKILKMNGARKVMAIVVARQTFNKKVL